jgi:hypothetical protein
MCSDKVPISPHFGNEIALFRKYRKEDEIQHLVGLTRLCVSTGGAERVNFYMQDRELQALLSLHKWLLLELADDFPEDPRIFDYAQVFAFDHSEISICSQRTPGIFTRQCDNPEITD